MSNVLGRGLDALLSSQEELPREWIESSPAESPLVSEQEETKGIENVVELPICEVFPNQEQPRKHFDEEKLRELSQSIKENGLLQPIIVRTVEPGRYEIVAGERRWRASKLGGIETIPALIREMRRDQVLKCALIENIQRDDLNPIDEARAYQKLIQEFHFTQEELAGTVGKKRSTITNSLRLLNLSQPCRMALVENKISMGHARALLGLATAETQERFLNEILSNGWSVREVERFIHTEKKKPRCTLEPGKKARNPFIESIQAQLMEILGTKVSITPAKKGGKIEIQYFSTEDLNRLVDLVKTRALVAA